MGGELRNFTRHACLRVIVFRVQYLGYYATHASACFWLAAYCARTNIRRVPSVFLWVCVCTGTFQTNIDAEHTTAQRPANDDYFHYAFNVPQYNSESHTHAHTRYKYYPIS